MQPNDKERLFSGMLPGDVDRLEIINIKKFMMSRSLEIDDMFNTLKRYDKQERVFQKLPFVMRRRAMSHNPFRVPKSIRFHIVSEMSKNTPKALKRIRKDKKRRLNRLEDYQKRSSKNTWLETHLYHAKRFKMANLWGYKLAVTATQKSKRRYLRYVKRNCLIHDRSYMSILSVTGKLDALRESFTNVFTDSYLLFNESFLSGNLKGGCVFSYHGSAECYRLACPVNFIWKRAKDDTHTVWFIVHPSARDELYNILIKFEEITTTMIDNMAIFELLGPLSGLYLKAVLKLDANSSTGNEIWKSLNPENITLPSHFILPLLIRSPEVIGSFSPEYKISMMKNHYHNMKYDYNCIDLSEERLKLHEFKSTGKPLARFVIPRRRKKNYTKLLEKLLKTINIQNSDGSSMDIKLKSTHIEAEISEVEPDNDNLIPVWLINRNLPIVGFDLILPANTIANKLWILLNRYGALGLGIEDREFILNRFNQTTFPQDYPDTYSGISHYSDIKRAEISNYLICPSSKRVNYSLIGMDNPFAIPYFGKERKLNLKLPVDLVPECHKGRFDGNLLNSRHLLLSSITSGLYNAMENVDFTVLRLTSNPLGSMNVYFTALLTQLQSNEFQNVISKVPTNQYISSRITPLRKGTVEFLSRIYLPKTEDHKLFPPDLLTDPGVSKTKLYVPNLQEPIHEEYKLSNIKLLLYGDNKKHKLDINSAISQLKALSNRGITTYRQCIGFVTSRGIMKTGGCFIQLRAFLQMIKDSVDIEKIPSCDKLRLIVWIRNRSSPEYFPDDRCVAVSCDESSMSSLDHCDNETNHVERPERISSIIKHLKNAKLSDGNDSVALWNKICYVSCKEVPRNILQLCHTEDYLDTISYWTAEIAKLNGSLSDNLKSKNNVKSMVLYPLDEDTYMTCQSERVANLAVGGVISLCDLIMDESSSISKGFAIIRPPGHHATSDRMMGFCIYNNVALATKYLMSHYTLRKVAIIDWDVHQGNGTQEIFNDDPNVCFISTHRYGKAKSGFYPYQGDVHEKDIRNNIINIPLDSGFTSDDLIYSFNNIILPILNDFKPEFILISAGFDAALGDLLGGCKVKPYAYSYIVYKLCQFAQLHCRGRILLALEGGYEVNILSKCVEGIIKTIIEFEMGLKSTIASFNGDSEDYVRVSGIASENITEAKYCKGVKVDPKGNVNIARPCVMQSTIRTCTKILNFLNLDIISGFDSLKINANNSKINISWTEYTHKLSNNTLVLAGGHQNQWIISMNDQCKEVVKLCSRQEVEFYIWLYNSNNLTLELISEETPNFKLDFGDGLEDACLSGLRFTDVSSEVKEMARYDDPVIIDRPSTNNNVVFDVIKFITECSATYQSSVFKQWELNSIHDAAIRIKNALYGMKSPCVMDLKMGTRLYGDDCTDIKVIEYKQKKARDRTCGSHGFHISGIFNWNRSKKVAKYLAHESVVAIKSDLEIIHAFKLYLMLAIDKGVICRIVDKLVSRLNDLKVIFEKQTSLAFYGTSLLFVFDSLGDDIVSSANVYMIDLSHISYNANRIDEGYLLGINSIIRLLNSARADINGSL